MKGKGFAFTVLIVAVVIFIISVSSGSSDIENDLIETLPVNIKTYILEDCYSVDELQYDYKGEQILEIKSLKIESRSTEGKSGTADCVIEMEDAYVKKTAYVTLYIAEYDTGWVVENWEETAEADVTLKYEPDIEFLRKQNNFKNITVLEENLDMEGGQYNYHFSVNDTYAYAVLTGDIKLSAHKSESYNYTYELPVYGWHYDVEENVNLNWNVIGTWTLTYNDSLTNKMATVSIDSLDSPIYDSLTSKHVGSYYGNAYYYTSNSWLNGQKYESNYDYSDGSGDYRIYEDFDLMATKLQIDGHSSSFDNCSIMLEFTPDTVCAYLDGENCYSVVKK